MSQDANSRFESEPDATEATSEPTAARLPSDGAPAGITTVGPDPTAAAVEAVRMVEGGVIPPAPAEVAETPTEVAETPTEVAETVDIEPPIPAVPATLTVP